HNTDVPRQFPIKVRSGFGHQTPDANEGRLAGRPSSVCWWELSGRSVLLLLAAQEEPTGAAAEEPDGHQHHQSALAAGEGQWGSRRGGLDHLDALHLVLRR